VKVNRVISAYFAHH